MIETIRKRFNFKQKEVWFAKPVNDRSYDSVHYIVHKDYGDIRGFERRVKNTIFIDLSIDLDIILRNMKKVTRYEIKRIGSDGNIKIKTDENRKDYYELYKRFQKRKKLKIESLQSLLKSSKLFNCYYKNYLVCSVLFYDDFPIARARKINSVSWQTQSIGKKNISYLQRYTIWSAIKHFKHKNYKIFDLGGIVLNKNSTQYGITQYKMSFGGKVTPEYHYLRYNNFILRLASRFI